MNSEKSRHGKRRGFWRGERGFPQSAEYHGVWMVCWEKAGHGPQDVRPGKSSPWEAAATSGGS